MGTGQTGIPWVPWDSNGNGMGMGGNWELIDGKNGNGFMFQMGMGMKSLKWEGFGTNKKICSRTSLVPTLEQFCGGS